MRVSRYVPVVSVLALLGALAGCNNPGTGTTAAASGLSASPAALAMPLTTGPETPLAPAPPARALPRAAPVRVAHVTRPEDNYAYVERAYAMSNAFGDAPPDYDYDYGPTRVSAWRGYDNSVRLVEPVDRGNRYYYYQPGRDVPYLVRDEDNSYGYDDSGELVVVYDREGRPVPYADRYADEAARELARARSVYAASLNSQRREVRAANWAARRAQIDAARSEWAAEQSREAEWRAYHDAHAAEQAAYWQTEQQRRVRENQAFDDRQRRDYQGPVPVVFTDRRDAYQADMRRQQQALAEQRQHDQIAAQARLEQQRADLQALQRQQQLTQRQAQEQRQHDQIAAQARLDQQQALADQRKLADQKAQQHQEALARLQAEAEQRKRDQIAAQARLDQQRADQQAQQRQQQIAHQQQILAEQRQKADQQAREHQQALAQQQQRTLEAQRAHEQAALKAQAAAHQQALQRQAEAARQQQQQQLAQHQHEAEAQKALAAQQHAREQAAAHQQQVAAQHKAHPTPPQNSHAHDHGHSDGKPGGRHDNGHDEKR